MNVLQFIILFFIRFPYLGVFADTKENEVFSSHVLLWNHTSILVNTAEDFTGLTPADTSLSTSQYNQLTICICYKFLFIG